MISGVFVSFIHTYEYGLCVTFANFHNQLYWTYFGWARRKKRDEFVVERSTNNVDHVSSGSQFGQWSVAMKIQYAHDMLESQHVQTSWVGIPVRWILSLSQHYPHGDMKIRTPFSRNDAMPFSLKVFQKYLHENMRTHTRADIYIRISACRCINRQTSKHKYKVAISVLLTPFSASLRPIEYQIQANQWATNI